MIGHSDRKKLRPLIAAISEDKKTFYLASELSAIHQVDKTQNFWQPDPGKPVIASTDGIILKGNEDQERGIWI
jgi:glutamate synthase domain-containing protein 1